jgi:hypothetical protein
MLEGLKVDLFYFTTHNTGSGIGYNQVEVKHGDNRSREIIKNIESDPEFDHWNHPSEYIIRTFFSNFLINKPKTYNRGN